MYSLGIDIGYSSIKLTLIDEYDCMTYNKYVLHKGNIKDALKIAIEEMLLQYSLENIKFGAITGSGSELLNDAENIETVNEIAAIIEGSLKTNNSIESIIEIGGQSAKYITEFSEKDKSQVKFSINSNCAAGTGAFLEEQISRLNLQLKDYSSYAARGKTIPRIAGRCSVFAKTDIIHHQQEGVPVEDILLGLAYSVIRNYRGAVMKKLPTKKPILFIGGVANNQSIIRAIKDILSLEEEELILPEYFSNIASLGTAIIAKRENKGMNIKSLLGCVGRLNKASVEKQDNALPKLVSFGKDDSINKHLCKPMGNEKVDCYLGIDIGSTSTNLVLMDEEHQVISYKYLRTLGNPVEAVNQGLKELEMELKDKVEIIGVGTTGSGRYMIGEIFGADVIKDEITAQGKAATTLDSSVDTVFEIGGQDSKYISCENGIITDFEMNKICAAGTGSFIEEQAKKLNIAIEDLGRIALESTNPVNLGERCTVFIETNVATSLSKGASLDDIASGLCYSIAKNYLNRVVGQKKIGNKIFLQGGIAYNQGIVNAFRQLVGDKIFVPPFFSVTGALGVAILAKEEMGGKETKFKGLENSQENKIVQENRVEELKESKTNIYDEVEKLYLKNYEPTVELHKKTVGIPRVLFLHKMFPMFYIYFKTLGFNVLLSDQSNEETVRLSQEYSLDETCYPVKLINGHVAELINKRVDYVFLPSLYTMKHDISKTRQDYGCAYMQLAPKIIRQTMELDEKGIQILSPVLSFNFGKKYMMKTLLDLGKDLGKGTIETARAIQKGMMALKSFEKNVEILGEQEVQSLKPDEKAFIIITRAYGAVDTILNMKIPQKIMEMGYKVLTLSNLPAHDHDIFKEHPNMYWPFGQHILSGAQIVKEHPNLYPIYITNHGCGPDTILAHYFKEEVGDKPYLNIEVDEHSSSVGVITRVEAFINSISKEKVGHKKVENLKVYSDQVVHKEVNMKFSLDGMEGKDPLFIPYMYPCANIFKELLIKRGINAEVLPMTEERSVEIGRGFTITKETFSLTAMLGDVFKKVKELESNENIGFLIPTSEGTEVNGQYSRLVRSKLDGEGFEKVKMISPFIEDLILGSEEDTEEVFLALLSGDLIRAANRDKRDLYLDEIIALIKNNGFNIENLKEVSAKIYRDLNKTKGNKKVLVVGEPMILFNDFMNNFTFKDIEEKQNRVVYAPFSEYMWFVWKDFLGNSKIEKVKKSKGKLEKRLEIFRNYMLDISQTLLEETPFEENLENLITIANKNLKHYSGGNGRYRQAKLLGKLNGIHGIITTASMYENTNTILNIIQKEIGKDGLKPTMNLTFDGNKNKSDEMKVESFMYYI